MKPHEAIKIINMHRFLLKDGDLDEALKMAIKALEKQIPMKPVRGNISGSPNARCPACKAIIYDSDWREATQRMYHQDICLDCGQKLTKPGKYLGDWED